MDHLKATLNLHQQWLNEAPGGLRANLSGANLMWADLSWANLRDANLCGANLCWSNLMGVDLSGANLSYANLIGSKLIGSKLIRANLRGSNLSESKLSDANLTGADLLCTGDMLFIRTMQFDTWYIGYTHDTLQIGCQTHPIEKWKRWDTPAGHKWVDSMDEEALDWAERNLNLVLQIIEANPASKSDG